MSDAADPPPVALAPADAAKFTAARRATDLVEAGTVVGLGTGSTAAFLVRCLARRSRVEGLAVDYVATSQVTADLATALGLRVVALDAVAGVDLTIDGADEIAPDFSLIKGGGAALLREKIVAAASRRLVVIADAGKSVATLGAFPLPVEVTPFGHATTARAIAAALQTADVDSRTVTPRRSGDDAVVTDNGNLIYDLELGRIGAPDALDAALRAIPGVVETGLFLGLCETVILGDADGRAQLRGRDGSVETRRVDLSEAARLPDPVIEGERAQ